MYITRIAQDQKWQSWGLLLGRLIMAAIFLMGFVFKVMMPQMQAESVAQVGLPFPMLLVVLGAIFEFGLVIAFATGLCMREGAMLAIPYILFLAYMFHGPHMWGGNPMEFGFFVDHFTFTAGLIFMVATGPGKFAWKGPAI